MAKASGRHTAAWRSGQPRGVSFSSAQPLLRRPAYFKHTFKPFRSGMSAASRPRHACNTGKRVEREPLSTGALPSTAIRSTSILPRPKQHPQARPHTTRLLCRTSTSTPYKQSPLSQAHKPSHCVAPWPLHSLDPTVPARAASRIGWDSDWLARSQVCSAPPAKSMPIAPTPPASYVSFRMRPCPR